MICPSVRPSSLPKHKDKKVQVEGVANDNESLLREVEPKMPVVYGEIRGQRVSVLRDSGSTTALVRRSLVRNEELTGKSSAIIMIDRREKWLPEAEIEVSTPYYSGKLKVKCMENPLYDLILGNIAGVRKVNDPDHNWKTQRKWGEERRDQLENEREEPVGIVSTVMARDEIREDRQTTTQHAPAVLGLALTTGELADEQRKDVSLKECFF